MVEYFNEDSQTKPTEPDQALSVDDEQFRTDFGKRSVRLRVVCRLIAHGWWLTLRSAAFAQHTKSIPATSKQRWVPHPCGFCKGAGSSCISAPFGSTPCVTPLHEPEVDWVPEYSCTLFGTQASFNCPSAC
jgi:hypothetical protein